MNDALPSEIRMGNDIIRALEHPLDEQVAEAAAAHLRKFWDPRLRRALVERVRLRDPRIDPLLALAVAKYLADEPDRADLAEPSGG